jgi:hypothetical protein
VPHLVDLLTGCEGGGGGDGEEAEAAVFADGGSGERECSAVIAGEAAGEAQIISGIEAVRLDARKQGSARDCPESIRLSRLGRHGYAIARERPISGEEKWSVIDVGRTCRAKRLAWAARGYPARMKASMW